MDIDSSASMGSDLFHRDRLVVGPYSRYFEIAFNCKMYVGPYKKIFFFVLVLLKTKSFRFSPIFRAKFDNTENNRQCTTLEDEQESSLTFEFSPIIQQNSIFGM